METAKAKNYQLVPSVRNDLAISQEQLGRLLKSSSRSVARWEKEKKSACTVRNVGATFTAKENSGVGSENLYI